MQETAPFRPVFPLLPCGNTPPVLLHVLAHARAGVAPHDVVSLLHHAAAAPVVGLLSVDAVHPAGLPTAVELVQMADALHIIAAVAARVRHLQLDASLFAGAFQDVIDRLPFGKGNLGLFQDHAAGRDVLLFGLLYVVQII